MRIQSLNNNLINNNSRPVFKSSPVANKALTPTEIAFLLSSPKDMDEYLKSSDEANKSDVVTSNPISAVVKKIAKMFDILSANVKASKILSTDPKEVDAGFDYIYTQIYNGI